MKRLAFVILVAGLLAGSPQPTEGAETGTTPIAPVAVQHPADVCMDDLAAVAAARHVLPVETVTDNEVRTALSVVVVNSTPLLRGTVTLRTAETNPLIEKLRRHTPGQLEYRDTLIDLLTAKPGIGPFGRGR